jgi:hypothetical protein
MNKAVVVALALVVAGGFYIRLRWSRSPQAYRAMVAIAADYFVAGLLVGAWALHSAAPKRAEAVAQTASANAPAAAVGAAAGGAVNAPSTTAITMAIKSKRADGMLYSRITSASSHCRTA